jgi:hypothetical protein
MYLMVVHFRERARTSVSSAKAAKVKQLDSQAAEPEADADIL